MSSASRILASSKVGSLLILRTSGFRDLERIFRAMGCNYVQKSRLGEKGVAWTRVAHLVSGILGYTEGFLPERELSRLGEKWHSEAVEAVRSSLKREDPRLSERVRFEFLKWAGFCRLSENGLA
ncbi:hypothetical protein Lal_00035422 [Lupinus albus]|nr:hypothetical protein Lal_00035422 [Lupinus albus]